MRPIPGRVPGGFRGKPRLTVFALAFGIFLSTSIQSRRNHPEGVSNTGAVTGGPWPWFPAVIGNQKDQGRHSGRGAGWKEGPGDLSWSVGQEDRDLVLFRRFPAGSSDQARCLRISSLSVLDMVPIRTSSARTLDSRLSFVQSRILMILPYSNSSVCASGRKPMILSTLMVNLFLAWGTDLRASNWGSNPSISRTSSSSSIQPTS